MIAEALQLRLVNGLPVEHVPADDRGLAYGDGLYETFRVSNGRVTLRELHFERLWRGAGRLKLELDQRLIESEVAEIARQMHEGVLKLTVTRGSGPRGYRFPDPQTPLRIIQTAPLPPVGISAGEAGVRLFCCQTRLAQQPLLAGIKHLNRLEQVLARSEWQDPAIPEGLMQDTDGNLVEGTMSNLFLRFADTWVTPDLSLCGVQGVMRDHLINALRGSGETVTVRHVRMEELGHSTEVFCCNSVFGVWPVVGAATCEWPIGAATRQAQALSMQALE
ncbi:aminodeoxychorismate lyase apoprotein [Halopseudomonas xinjiangensis]|uniref:Aminodeoxychorismate lyase n=1 Tax=Halopseudomonas xinjiangensis TaxID=487184 RepID=A0A1H1RJ53_9GAMM|nr:aminodeoxychorismate lyase [Halopseudomonas xinjiangensis]SDS35738.1 aminodeoxychorismate lyase apoprotein [Halopseudomonas xinjiangensis]